MLRGQARETYLGSSELSEHVASDCEVEFIDKNQASISKSTIVPDLLNHTDATL
jgi:hypothetical protein